MRALLAVLLTLVAVAGLLVVRLRDPVLQAIVLSVLGLLLAMLFFALQSPEVALSELVVGGAALPLMLMLALARIAGQSVAAKPLRRMHTGRIGDHAAALLLGVGLLGGCMMLTLR